jgi:hypothetical protein
MRMLPPLDRYPKVMRPESGTALTGSLAGELRAGMRGLSI